MIDSSFRNACRAWDRFWFHPRDPLVLGSMRFLAGAIILYTHAVWTFELEGFFGPAQLLPIEHNRLITGSLFAWSHFHWIESWSILWTLHWVALLCMLMFCLGLMTRVTGILTALFTISYANRAVGATFGLDQINVLLAFYLAIGPSGQSLSLDRWIRSRKSGKSPSGAQSPSAPPSILANFTTRLIQVHLCIIYFFAGTSKLLGATWWNGEAIWGALANAEYQTVDMTWLAAYPYLINLMTHLALAWEATYFILVWPRWSRKWVIAMAFAVHLGIGITMGMMEFGLIMITANLAFLSPVLLRKCLSAAGVSGSTDS